MKFTSLSHSRVRVRVRVRASWVRVLPISNFPISNFPISPIRVGGGGGGVSRMWVRGEKGLNDEG